MRNKMYINKYDLILLFLQEPFFFFRNMENIINIFHFLYTQKQFYRIFDSLCMIHMLH